MGRWIVGTSLAVVFGCLGLASGNVRAQDSKAPVKPYEDFDPENFDRSTQIDNEWFPLKPGMRFTFEGSTIEEGRPVPHRVVFTVTDLTKVIDGVRTVVCWDQDFSAGKLQETEIVFFAQDKSGAVWHLGQYPEVYENGKLVEAPAWIHGIQDARAGIMMKAAPRLGMPSYSEGWAPSVKWTDRGVVDQMGQKTCVRLKCYEDVLVIDETSKEEPDAHQIKYYAKGVGYVRVGWRGEGDKAKETLELVALEELGPEALADARVDALKLEKRAYATSKGVYAHTTPAERMPGAGSR